MTATTRTLPPALLLAVVAIFPGMMATSAASTPSGRAIFYRATEKVDRSNRIQVSGTLKSIFGPRTARHVSSYPYHLRFIGPNRLSLVQSFVTMIQVGSHMCTHSTLNGSTKTWYCTNGVTPSVARDLQIFWPPEYLAHASFHVSTAMRVAGRSRYRAALVGIRSSYRAPGSKYASQYTGMLTVDMSNGLPSRFDSVFRAHSLPYARQSVEFVYGGRFNIVLPRVKRATGGLPGPPPKP